MISESRYFFDVWIVPPVFESLVDALAHTGQSPKGWL